MSTKARWSSLREVETQLCKRRARLLQMAGYNLSKEDTDRVIDSYRLMLVMVSDIVETLKSSLCDSEWQSLRRHFSAARLAWMLEELCKLDVGVTAKQFKNATQMLRHISDKDMPQLGRNYLSLKKFNKELRSYAKAYDVATDGVVWLIIQPFFSLFIRVDSQMNFIHLNDILQFNCRLTLKDVNWIEEENIQAYVDFEEKLHAQEYDHQLLAEMRNVITDWFRDFSFEKPWVSHGYGATAGVRRSEGTTAKYHDMIPTTGAVTIAKWLDWQPSDQSWEGIMSSYREYSERQCSNLLNGLPMNHGLTTPSDLVCRVQLVPKGVDKKRVVSMEPTVHQFYQKQIGSLLDTHFRKHPEMRIDLHDQSKNCRLTLQGSKYRNYGTIDLSSASDSVTYTVVKECFKNVPKLWSAMECCRTTKAMLPDGRIVALEKFTPMGSADCFPIECVIFSAVVAVANRHLGINTYYRIYGDDMVVHNLVWDEVIDILNRMNFIVNEDKSFHSYLPFKESCGIEAYRGQDVSPIRLSRKWDVVESRRDSEEIKILQRLDNEISYLQNKKRRCRKKNDKRHLQKAINRRELKIRQLRISQQLDSMYKLGNDCFNRSYWGLRQLIIQRAQAFYGRPVFSNNTSHGFLTYSANIGHNYQHKYIHGVDHVKLLVTRSYIKEGSNLARLSKLLEEYDRTNRQALLLPEERIEVMAGSAHTYMKYTWVPLSDLTMEDWERDRISFYHDLYLKLLNTPR